MSSKTQYKDVIKRMNRTISELKKENQELKDELERLSCLVRPLIKYEPKIKKWWIFWK